MVEHDDYNLLYLSLLPSRFKKGLWAASRCILRQSLMSPEGTKPTTSSSNHPDDVCSWWIGRRERIQKLGDQRSRAWSPVRWRRDSQVNLLNRAVLDVNLRIRYRYLICKLVKEEVWIYFVATHPRTSYGFLRAICYRRKRVFPFHLRMGLRWVRVSKLEISPVDSRSMKTPW
jgi:hypothetical protein